MHNIDKDIDYFQKLKKEHHNSSMPMIFDYDSLYRNIFLSLATLSSTIGAFSFVLFTTIENKNCLILGDSLLLLTIIISMTIYIIETEKDHTSVLNSYRKIQKDFDDQINGLLEVKKGEIKVLDFYKLQKNKFEKRVSKNKKYENRLPNYFWQIIVLILFVYALISIGFSIVS